MKNKRHIMAVMPVILLATLLVSFPSCKNKGTSALSKETPTSGNIRIAVDESFKPIIEAEIDTFTALYNYAHITPVYQPENELIAFFLSDSQK